MIMISIRRGGWDSDLSIPVAVYIYALQGNAVLAIGLLQDIERIGCIANRLDLDLIARTAGNPGGSIPIEVGSFIAIVELGDLVIVVGKVEIQVPAKIPCPDWRGVDVQFRAFVYHRADIDGQLICKIGPDRNGYRVEQVGDVLLIDVDGT